VLPEQIKTPPAITDEAVDEIAQVWIDAAARPEIQDALRPRKAS
jgi:hypothetical protein